MAGNLRQLEIVLSARFTSAASDVLTEFGAESIWVQDLRDELTSVRGLVPERSIEPAMDKLSSLIGSDSNQKIILSDVQAVLPRVEEPEESKEKEDEEEEKPEPKFGPSRIGREELYTQVHRSGRLTIVFAVLVALSSIVASVGILRDNTGVVIGAMVIAPLLGPSVALALGATLGDTRLMRQAAKATGVGFTIALALSIATGAFVDLDLGSRELTSRTDVGVAEVALALASGVAAALAFTTGASSALIGVMVAVALLPPTVALGMLIGSGEWTLARGAALLVLVNFTAVNLTGVATFTVQGIRPARWWETAKARRSTRLAVVAWAVFLAALVSGILLSE